MQSNRPSPIFVCGTPPTAQKERFFNKARGQRFETKASNDLTEIDLFDEIGDFGVSAKDFSAQLKNATGNVVLRINSPGGDVFQGIAIYNALLAHQGSVRVEILGVAASAASVIAMAGDEIAMAENAFIMIHNAWSLTIGNQEDHDNASDILGQIDQSLASTYAKRTGINIKAVSQMMDAETWLDAQNAKANGFATEIIANQSPNARFDISVYANAPAELTGIDTGIDPTDINIRELENILREAGIPRRKAKALAAYGIKTPDDLRDADDEVSDLAAYFAATATNIHNLKELH
jgi:ATP-dependent Clp protease protease subunit